ncbi:MAG: 2'-5' RNA ligase family protein [Candidatus Thiodiazotropha endolucinida]
MRIDKPTYLIAELQGDVVPLVNELRKRFNPDCSQWPVDITIAGSSGIGTIKEEQMIADVIDILSPVINKYGFKKVAFKSISRFPNTGIYYLVPDRYPFDILHEAVVKSGILFNENKWPYNPHCTLRAGPSPTDECSSLFETMSIPINTSVEFFSLYQPVPCGGFRVHRF